MGLYFRAEFWFARIGAGLYGGREERDGTVDRSRGRGDVIAAPYGEKFSGVRGSGDRRRRGFVVKTGAGMVSRRLWAVS